MPPRIPKSENEPTEPVRVLLEAVRKGDTPYRIARRVAALSDAERRACVPWFDQLRKSWAVRSPLPEPRKALRIAGIGCRTGAAAATQWLLARDLGWASGDEELPLIIYALADRDAEWLGDVAHRLAERPSAAEEKYELISVLVRRSGCPVPTTDAFVRRWVTHLTRRPDTEGTLLERLRGDPFLTALVPRLFEAQEIGNRLVFPPTNGPQSWPYSLARLGAEGRLDRRALIDGCLSRLLLGERPFHLRGFLPVLRELDLTEDERAARVVTWIRLLPDSHSTVATLSQQVLAGLEAAGRLETRHLAEASRAVLFRTEKKLLRAQLTLLDKAVKRDPSRAGKLLPTVAEAFAHEHHSIQEQALRLVTRHLAHADHALRAELAAAAERLTPGLRGRATEAFGGAVGKQRPYALASDVLPPVPRPSPPAPAARTVAELAQDVGALLAAGGDPTEFERALDGLVRHAHQDVTALVLALEPVARQHPSWFGDSGRVNPRTLGIDILVAAVRRAVSREAIADAQDRAASRRNFDAIVITRVLEAAQRVLARDPVPFLLATPTWSSGAIDPPELVARVRAYEEAGAEPGRADFHQALLRVGRHSDSAALEAAAGLTSPAGRRLAQWFANGGLPDPAVHPVVEKEAPTPARRWGAHRTTRRVLLGVAAVSGCKDFPEPFRSLFLPFGPDDPRWGAADPRHALAVVPCHREITAARLLWQLVTAVELDARGDTRLLPALAEADGPAGPAVHLSLAYGLGARRPEDRLSAVDALLTLAAREQLDAVGLGQGIAALVELGALKAQRLTDFFQETARAGAPATTWAVLAAALPGLLIGPLAGVQVHGLAGLMSVAADCAERTGARGPVPEVTVVARRGGSSQLARQTRRLYDTLSGE